MEVATPGVTNGLAAAQGPSVDPKVVVQYLTEVLQVTLGATKEDLEGQGSLLSKAKYSETVQKCTRFASESQVALYVQQDIVGTEEPNGTENENGMSCVIAIVCDCYLTSLKEQRIGLHTPSLPKFRFLLQPSRR
jgi:hypothetical protein